MTNEEITEAQKLIAGMRDSLSLIAGSSDDADKAASEVLEICPNIVNRLFNVQHPTSNTQRPISTV